MSNSTDRETAGGIDSKHRDAQETPGVNGVGTYESGDGVVFYDTENPLAWMQSAETVALEEME